MKSFYIFISAMISLSVLLQFISVINRADVTNMDRQIKSYQLYIAQTEVKIAELELANEKLKARVFGTLAE